LLQFNISLLPLCGLLQATGVPVFLLISEKGLEISRLMSNQSSGSDTPAHRHLTRMMM
jgi:hypothetical protein